MMSLVIKSVFVSFLALVSCGAIAQEKYLYDNYDVMQSDEYKRGNKYQKDFLLLNALLKEHHPVFSILQRPQDCDSIVLEQYSYCSTCNSNVKFRYFIQSVVSRLHDGHTQIEGIDHRSELTYPVTFFDDETGIYVFSTLMSDSSFIGKRVSSMNGINTCDLIEAFRPLVSASNNIEGEHRAIDRLTFFNAWSYLGKQRSDSLLIVQFSDSTKLHLKPIYLNGVKMFKKTLPTDSPRKYEKRPFSYTILQKQRLCYMQFDQCEDKATLYSVYHNMQLNEKQRIKIDEILKNIPAFDEFLDEMFEHMEREKVKVLIIDVRYNGGGNSVLCEKLLSRLSSHPIKLQTAVCKECDTRSLEDLKDFYMPSYGNLPKFKGDVVFIQGRSTYSSAGLLITTAVDNNIGYVIGDKSSFSPTHYGDPISWILPNTGQCVFVSQKLFVRPNRIKKETFVDPRVYIPSICLDIILGRDKCWEWIEKKYKK